MLSRRQFCAALTALAGLGPSIVFAADGLAITGTRQGGTHTSTNPVSGWVLAYFGYTNCPDVCPLGLQSIADALDALGPLADRITPVFVTVDPDRDTPARMREYVAFFHPRFVAITPTADELKPMAKAWRVKFARVDVGEGRPYLMDHTASLLLADPSGNPAGRFPHDMAGPKLAEKIAEKLAAMGTAQ